MAHLENIPVTISLRTFVKEVPECHADFIKHLQSLGKAPATPSDSRNPAIKRPVEPLSEQPPNARPFVLPRPAPTDNGPTRLHPWRLPLRPFTMLSSAITPMQWSKQKSKLLGRPLSASLTQAHLTSTLYCHTQHCNVDTILSHSVVRRLGLMDQLLPSRVSSLTAAGKTKRPMGMLPNLPITIGSLCLHVDCMVTKANNYNALIGFEWRVQNNC